METIQELRRALVDMQFHDPNFRDSSFIRLKVLADLEARGLLSQTLEWTDRHAKSGRACGERFRAPLTARTA
jgi:hypothetical protein